MVKHDIERLIANAVAKARDAGDLRMAAKVSVTLERPQAPEHGDYASSLALQLARVVSAPPMKIAEAVAANLAEAEELDSVKVVAPGFINFHLAKGWLARQVDAIIARGNTFGNLPVGKGQRLQVEFVSANPVGPLHVGNGRGLAIGDTLANVLAAAGFEVQREYLVNDAGTQTKTFAATLYNRYQALFGRKIDSADLIYPGEYMVELAEQLRQERGDSLLQPLGEPPPKEIHDLGVEMMMASIKDDLTTIGVRYDNWFRERSLYSTETYEKAMALVRKKGYVSEKEGAVWLASSALGDDKDNVLVRSSGAPTYFASDIAYHYDKFLLREFDRVINIWGADHQGHVQRMKASISAMGIDPQRLTIIIYQLVTLKRGAEVVRLSKRSGDVITLREVMDEVGADAVRFFFLQRAASTHMDFDLELASRHSAENPVYYVKYAHARIASILARAEERISDFNGGEVSLLDHEAELALIRKLILLPEHIEAIADSLEPHQLPHYSMELATAFHDFYEKCRVISEDIELSKARLKLVAAAKIVLARTLNLMGIAAPDRM